MYLISLNSFTLQIRDKDTEQFYYTIKKVFIFLSYNYLFSKQKVQLSIIQIALYTFLWSLLELRRIYMDRGDHFIIG